MDAALSQLERSRLLMEQGRWALAADDLRAMLRDDPSNAQAHALLSLCLVERAEFEQARREAEEAVRLAEHDSLARFAQATVAFHQGQLEEARRAIAEAIRLEPSEPSYFAHLAKIESTAGNWVQSLRAANDGLACDPDDVECERMRSLALVALADRTPSAEGKQEQPSDPARELMLRGRELVQQGEPKQALESYRRAIEIDPKFSRAQRDVVEALKTRSAVYRVLLGLFSHCRYAGFGVRLMHIVMVWALHTYFAGEFGVDPILADHGNAILYAFSFYTCLLVCGAQMFNLVLLTSRYGRLVVNRSETIGALSVASCVVGSWCMVTIGYLYFPGDNNSWNLGYPPLLLAYSIGFVYYTFGWGRTLMSLYTLGYAAVVLATCLKWASLSIDLAAAMEALLQNQPPNPAVVNGLNVRVAEMPQWLSYCTYGMLGSFITLRVAMTLRPRG